jgi:hypothetical protein
MVVLHGAVADLQETLMTNLPLKTLGGLIAAAALATSASAHDPTMTRVTWTDDIARIFENRCVSCHARGAASVMPLSTYEEVRPWTGAIRQQVLTRRMPVWHAARGFGAFSNDPSLSPFDIGRIVAWVDAGAPRGEERSTVLRPAPDRLPDPPSRQRWREVVLPCGDRPLAGRLLAVSPRLAAGGSAGIGIRLPDGRREVVAWIRDFDVRYPATYWLRTPIVLPPGSRIETEAEGDCRLMATLAR